MLTKLEVSTPQRPTLHLPVSDEPTINPIQIRNIEGLGPVSADVASLPFGSIDGEAYLGSTVGRRNIVITVGLNPDWEDQTVASLRQLLYTYFMPKLGVTIVFESLHLPRVSIFGIVESMEPVIFSRDPEIQISILNHDPDFIKTTPDVVTGVIGNKASPFSPVVIDYPGTVQTGVLLKLSKAPAVAAYIGDIQFKNTWGGTPEEFSMLGSRLEATRATLISSVPKNKFVKADPYIGTNPDLFRYVFDTSKWPRLQLGANNIIVTGSAGAVGHLWELTYSVRYGGL